MTADFYSRLGVSSTASSDDIRRSYRKLAKSCHPDLAPNDPAAAIRFREISEAYAVLSDSQERAAYDYKQNHYMRSGRNYSFEQFSEEQDSYGQMMSDWMKNPRTRHPDPEIQRYFDMLRNEDSGGGDAFAKMLLGAIASPILWSLLIIAVLLGVFTNWVSHLKL